MTEKAYDSNHGLNLKLRDQRLRAKFTHDALQQMRFEFQKVTVCRKLIKLAIFISLSLPFGSMYFNETWYICLVVVSCYHE